MINQQSSNENLRPSDLTQEQDMLLLAGSKVSFREIYAREMNLPTVRNKFYKAEDVDDLFILINGMFTDISEQAYRQNKALTSTRKDLDLEKGEKARLKGDNENLVSQIQTLQNQNGDLKTKLEQKPNNDHIDTEEIDSLKTELANQQAAYTRLAQTAAEKLTNQQKILRRLNQEKMALIQALKQARSQQNDKTVLKNSPEIVEDNNKDSQVSTNKIAEITAKIAEN